MQTIVAAAADQRTERAQGAHRTPIKIQEPPFTIPDKNLHILSLKFIRGSIPRSPYAACAAKGSSQERAEPTFQYALDSA